MLDQQNSATRPHEGGTTIDESANRPHRASIGERASSMDNSPFPPHHRHRVQSAHFRTKINKIRGLSFDTMMDQSYPKNVFVCNKPMRGYEAHDKRFDIFENNPALSLKYKTMRLPQWQQTDPDKSKTMNFDLPSYCNNAYMPDITPISAKLDIGSKSLPIFLLLFQKSNSIPLVAETKCQRVIISKTKLAMAPVTSQT